MSDLLNYKGYSGSVAYSADDEGLVGKILHIKSTIAYFGESVAEIKAMFQQAVDEYLEMCIELGIEPEKPFKGSFNVRISSELHKKAVLEAQKQNISLNEFVIRCIENSFSIKDLQKNNTHHSDYFMDIETIFKAKFGEVYKSLLNINYVNKLNETEITEVSIPYSWNLNSETCH